MAKSDFGQRLKEAFGNATNAVIGNKIGVSEGAVGFYVRGRVPDSEILVKIADVTNCNLHWLLTGEGKQSLSDQLDLNEALRDMIREIVREELGSATKSKKRMVMPLELGEKQRARKSG